MSTDDKKSTQASKKQLSLKTIGRANLDALQLSKRYFSGELEAERKALVDIGFPCWRILRYEHIIDPETAALPLANISYVTPDTFRKHIRCLKRTANILPLEELLSYIKKGESPPDRSVAITIDGGWTDAFVHGFPIIKEEAVPTTFFLPTAFIGTQELLWRDKVLLTLMLLKEKNITIEPFEFFSEDIKKAFWDISPNGEASLPAIFIMIEGLRQASHVHRQTAVGFLGEFFNTLGGQFPLTPLFMNWEEVRIMKHFGASFGSLGHGHFTYRNTPIADIAVDLAQSMKILEHQIETPVRALAAPEGEFDGEAISTLELLKIHFCLLEDATPEGLSTDTFHILRRICPYQDTSYSTELFFCRLWNIPLGHSYVG